MRNGQPKKRKIEKKREPELIEPSSGNVFADLGLPQPELSLAKATIVHQICEAIDERKLSQTRVGAILKIDQPKVSALLRGRFEGYSVERLLRFLNALGRDVEIIVRPVAGKPARTRGVVA